MSMLWEDERYIRVYTRDTVDDDMLCWQARCVWLLILKKCTRAGLIELGQHGTRGLARSLGVPPDLVKIALNGDGLDFGLIDDGRVELHDDVLVVPNFIAAQEAKQSDAQRSREFRARAKDHARAMMWGKNESALGGRTMAVEGATAAHPAQTRSRWDHRPRRGGRRGAGGRRGNAAG